MAKVSFIILLDLPAANSSLFCIAFSFVTSAAGGRRRVSGDYGSISGGDARGSKFSLAMNQLFAEHKPDVDMDFLQSRRQSVIIGDPVKRPIIG